MFKRDYKIIIEFDVHDEPYWRLYRKGEPALGNEEETRMVSQTLGELKEKIDRVHPQKEGDEKYIIQI